MKTTYIDNDRFMDLICALADMVVIAKLGDSAIMDDEDTECGTKYTPQAQELFNEVYDNIESDFDVIAGIKPNIELV